MKPTTIRTASNQKKEDSRQTKIEGGGNGNITNLVTLRDSQSFESEQFKMLTAGIVNSRLPDPLRVIMVTSSQPGDGKSFVAANLAGSISLNTDKPVLLIDCDFHAPTVHTFFGSQQLPGLSDYLAGKARLASLLIKANRGRLSILPAGTVPDNSYKLLSSDKMVKLIQQLRVQCPDLYIILDTAPPNLIAESKLLAGLADGIALVVSHQQTRHEKIKEVIEILGDEKIFGIVVNRFTERTNLYGYGGCRRRDNYYRRATA